MFKKYLIVGQGLAGSILAQRFISKNISFNIIDDGHRTSSSVVAVGIMHPISFKRLILSWQALKFINVAKSFYRQAEQSSGVALLREMPIYRPITSEEESVFWQTRMQEEEYKGILGYSKEEDLNKLKTPNGVGIVYQGAQLNTNRYLQSVTEELKKRNRLIIDFFDFKKLDIKENEVTYLGEVYSDIIFCEGHQMIYNPFFSYLPHNVTQGEVLAIRSSDLPHKWVSRGCFFLPSEEDEQVLRVGSTYKWNCTDPSPTDQGKQELMDRVMKLGNVKEPKVIEHQAGVRPTTHDRRPYIGTHPEHHNVHIFNGMGSKTVMLAPELATQFEEYLNKGVALDREIDIFRCRKQQFAKFGFYEAKEM